jgi:3-dehydroquinate dehydratase/shikimate dehydrogenase
MRGRVDLVELRADHLRDTDLEAAGRLPGRAGLPVILTVRRASDGGKYAGTERDRCALLRRLVGQGFAYIDIEEDLQAPDLEDVIRQSGTRIIRSLHDYSGVPPGLATRFSGLARGPHEIPKAAVMPTTCAQLAELLDVFAATAGRERVLLGMGDIGFPTRVLAPRLGSSWCYASPTVQAVAPGQVTPVSLEDVYRFRSIGHSTAIFGVIGNPVMHSRSPLIHNRGFGALGIDAVYLPFLVPDLEGFWKVADALDVRGLSVTVPHKQAVVPLVMGDESVRRVGACNTLLREESGGPWTGTNTDAEGFLAPLLRTFGGALPPGLGATVVGAGGAGRAVVAALSAAGARVLVLNRTVENARGLATAFGAEAAGLDEAGIRRAKDFSDLVVQTTSAGMSPLEGIDPAPTLAFSGTETVYELVYSPGKTKFLQRALEAGCRVIYGRQMLLAQAMRQFRLFSGVDYPVLQLAGLEADRD